MKSIGIFICNYNKREYVVACVESILKQKYQDFDLYVVDNASTDDSVEILSKLFGNRISVIVNSQNVGGSGGFNTGLRKAIDIGYQYVMLVDNDVKMDENAVGYLYDFMENHAKVGITGAKILQMQAPDRVQDLGGKINYNKYKMEGINYGVIDENLPDIQQADYISTCTAIARMDAIKKFGIMPENNFIYWDDVEWSKKCQLSGYDTVAYGKAVVWHNHSIASVLTPFVKYYSTRNRLHYFAKYLEEDKIEDFKINIMEELFSTIYGCNYKGLTNVAQATVYAMEDFIDNIRGKAVEGRVLDPQYVEEPLCKLLTDKKRLLIDFEEDEEDEDQNYWILCFLIERLKRYKLDINMVVSLKKVKMTPQDFEKKMKNICMLQEAYHIIKYNMPQKEISDSSDLTIRFCKHVNRVNENILPVVYVDGYGNCIENDKVYEYFSNYNVEFATFKNKYEDSLDDRIKKLRRK